MNIRPINTEDYDIKTPGKLETSLVICSTPRCGSTFLGDCLFGTGKLGVPNEYFNFHTHLKEWQTRLKTEDLIKIISEIISRRTSPNGVFTFKAHSDHFDFLLKNIRVSEHFPNLKFVSIERKDALGQAISYYKASNSLQWASDQEKKFEVNFNMQEIDKFFNSIEMKKAYWNKFFHYYQIEPMKIIYEEFCEDPIYFVKQIGKFIGLNDYGSLSFPESEMKIQRNKSTSEWREKIYSNFKL